MIKTKLFLIAVTAIFSTVSFAKEKNVSSKIPESISEKPGKPPGFWVEYFHKSGKKIITERFSGGHRFKEGMAAVKRFAHSSEGKQNWGFINKKGDLVVGYEYEDVQDFSEGLAAVKNEGKWGYIDRTGKMVIESKFLVAESFSDGLAAAAVNLKENGESLGYIDKNGQFAVNPQFNHASPFVKGFAKVGIGNEYKVINKKGEITDKPEYFYNSLRTYDGPYAVTTGESNGKAGFVDGSGKTVIEYRYDEARDFYEDLAAVRIGDKWGYIDKKGRMKIKPEFDEALSFTEGLGNVKIKNLWGYINQKGKMVVEPGLSNESAYFSDGFIVLKKGKGGN